MDDALPLALIKTLLKRGVLSQDDVCAIADELDLEVGAGLTPHRVRCTIVEAASEDASVERRRSVVHIVRDGGKTPQD